MSEKVTFNELKELAKRTEKTGPVSEIPRNLEDDFILRSKYKQKVPYSKNTLKLPRESHVITEGGKTDVNTIAPFRLKTIRISETHSHTPTAGQHEDHLLQQPFKTNPNKSKQHRYRQASKNERKVRQTTRNPLP